MHMYNYVCMHAVGAYRLSPICLCMYAYMKYMLAIYK